MNWFNKLQKAPPLPRRSSHLEDIPYFSFDDLADVGGKAQQQAINAWKKKLDEALRMHKKRTAGRFSDEEILAKLKPEFDDKMRRNVYITDVGYKGPIKLFGKHIGYNPHHSEEMANLRERYESAENLRYRKYRPVELEKAMKKLLTNTDKSVDRESKLKRMLTAYLKSGAKFNPKHITILNASEFATGELKDLVRNNQSEPRRSWD